MKSRLNALLVCALCALLFTTLLAAMGSARTWALWHIPTLTPNFADLRVVTAGAESVRLGFDPLLQNPADPWGRPLNYPRIWQSLATLGVDQTHTMYIGAALILMFLVAVCMVLPQAGIGTLVLVLAALLSPAVLLGIERGNVDLLMFFLLAAATVTIRSRRSGLIAPMAILLAAVLKLYPIVAMALLLRIERPKAVRYAIGLLVCFGAYLLLTHSDIRLISAATPRATELSYGVNVAWMRLAHLYPSLGGGLRYVAILVLLLAAVAVSWLALYATPHVDRAGDPEAGDAFVVGAMVYLGTFLIGNNFDYRLMFLIFTLPQLAEWADSRQRPLALGAVLTLAAILGSLWHLTIAAGLEALGISALAAFLLDECMNWATFLGLLYCLYSLLPFRLRPRTEAVAAHAVSTLNTLGCSHSGSEA